MQKTVYQVLLSAPIKMVGFAFAILGFIGSVWPEDVKALFGKGIPVQTVSLVILAAGVLYFGQLWKLKPSEKAKT